MADAGGPSELLAAELALEGFATAMASTRHHARVLAGMHEPALVVIGELEEPSAAVELIEEIRAAGGPGDAYGRTGWDPSLPVLAVAAGGGTPAALRAFSAGADDVVAADVGRLELRARIEALLRRSSAESCRRSLRVNGLTIDLGARHAALDGRILVLRRLEFELLATLARDPLRVFSRPELLREVWGCGWQLRTRTVDSHASRLRRKLGARSPGAWVVATRGVGYSLTRPSHD